MLRGGVVCAMHTPCCTFCPWLLLQWGVGVHTHLTCSPHPCSNGVLVCTAGLAHTALFVAAAAACCTCGCVCVLAFLTPLTGEEPLYTQEVDCVDAPAIAAHARHTLLLQPGESIADCFVGEAGSPEQLLFEVSGDA